MIEYLYDAIRAVAGQEIDVAAVITDDTDTVITDGCKLMLHIDEEMLAFDGIYIAETQSWQFTIPAEATAGLKGKYYYCIMRDGINLCFKTPFYLV